MQAVPVQTQEIWIFSLNWSWQLSSASEVLPDTSGLSFERFTDVDSIYFAPWSEYERDEKRIVVWKWEFIIRLESLGQNYSVVGDFFDISSLEAGSIYINTQDEKNHVFLSLDTLVNVWLTDDNQDITYVDLYPHMYLRLNPSRIQFLKNADLVRISSVFDLWSLTWSLNNDIISWFLANTWIKSSDFFDAYIPYSKIQFQETANKFKEILSIRSWEFPWIKSLQKYFHLFLNDTKKRAYYKNNIFSDLTTLVRSDKKETQIIQDIVTELSLLESTPDDYKEIRNVIDYYYSIITLNSDFSHIQAKINIHALMLAINDNKISPIQESLLSLATLYEKYNLSWNYSYENLKSFSNAYVIKSWLENEAISLQDKQRFDYFSFFLGELFISRFSSADENLKDFWSKDNFNSLLQVMNNYVNINQKIYNSDDQKRATTGMYVHADVLKKLQDFMRSALFKDTRWENGVLIKSRKFQINTKETNLFQKNINQLLSFYNTNKVFLSSQDQNDAALINAYSLFDSQFKEYFLALSDYDNYLFTYDQTKQNLFWIETFGENDNDIIFSQSQALTYLRQFEQASLADINIDLKENFYQIQNFIVAGKNFSFSLYPYEAYKIDDIIINNNPIAVSYTLDSVEFDWKERAESARDEEERDRYDFSKFFLNTFSNNSTNDTQDVFEINRNEADNDKIITVFKRDKLLSNTWEFASVQSFLDIDFSDIDVVQNNDIFDIFIRDADIEASYETSELSAKFDADYVLAQNQHFFKNIILSPHTSNLWIKKPEIWGNPIQIIGNINLVDLESEMSLLAKNYPNVKYMYNSISKNLWVDKVGIRYLKSSQKVNFRFDYQWDFVSILLFEDTIANVSQAWEILLKDVNYRTTDDILTTIKK